MDNKKIHHYVMNFFIQHDETKTIEWKIFCHQIKDMARRAPQRCRVSSMQKDHVICSVFLHQESHLRLSSQCPVCGAVDVYPLDSLQLDVRSD